MLLLKKINTSAVLCVDDDGRQLVALGKGIGFLDRGEEIPLARIDRTFYDVDERYLNSLTDIPQDVFEFVSQIVNMAEGLLSYPLSPNLPFILADHVAFAIKRAREGIHVRMPLAFDVQQQYPLEYRIGAFTVDRINRSFNVHLPKNEAVGIAMAFVNNATQASMASAVSSVEFDRLLERCVDAVERIKGVTIDRESFNFTRFATHMQYLYRRVEDGGVIESGNVSMYPQLREEYPDVDACVCAMNDLFIEELGHSLSDEERLYLMLHVNRIVIKANDKVGG